MDCIPACRFGLASNWLDRFRCGATMTTMKGTIMDKFNLFAVLLLAAFATTIQAGPVQDAIQSAVGNGFLELPAGEYAETIVLPEGFTLIGAGAGQTILDGGGAGTVVVMGNNAALIGCTVRNGQIGIRSQKGFIGVFECSVSGIVHQGIRLDGGSACVVKNAIDCGPEATGIACFESNPYVNRNVIRNNKVGVSIQGPLAPVLNANVFQSNATAVAVQPGASVELTGNLFDGNGTAVAGRELGSGDEIRAARPGELRLAAGHSREGCRSMMQVVVGQAIAAHPLVQYNLPPEPGRFYLAILYPCATFQIMASAPDTVIESYDAYDGATDRDLQAQFVTQGAYSGVAVVNPEIKECSQDRYVLEKTFIHPASYAADADGGMVFDRLTNIPRIEVLLPAGYEATAANPGATIDSSGPRQRVKLDSFGLTKVHLAMKKTGFPAP